MSIKDTEIDKDQEELRGLRSMEMTLKLHHILMSGYSDSLVVIFTLLSMHQKTYDMEDAEIICDYLEYNKKMIAGEVICSPLLPADD
jgi:hypothetical protein